MLGQHSCGALAFERRLLNRSSFSPNRLVAFHVGCRKLPAIMEGRGWESIGGLLEHTPVNHLPFKGYSS